MRERADRFAPNESMSDEGSEQGRFPVLARHRDDDNPVAPPRPPAPEPLSLEPSIEGEPLPLEGVAVNGKQPPRERRGPGPLGGPLEAGRAMSGGPHGARLGGGLGLGVALEVGLEVEVGRGGL